MISKVLPWLFLAALALPVLARDAGRPEFPNTFGLFDTPSLGTPGNHDTAAKQPLYPTIGGTTGIFVTIGQSRIANISSSPASQYVPTNGIKCLNFNPYDGQIYKLIDPVLGATANASLAVQTIGWHGQLCDKLINAGKYTQILFMPVAQSGASVADFLSGTGFANIRVKVAASWLTNKGLTPTGWLWQQGTTDCINGMSQSTYQADLRAVIAYERSLGRGSDKWMIAQDSVKDGIGTLCTAIRLAQATVAGDSNNLLGPDADSLPTTDYDAGPHFNDTGNDAIAGLWSTKIQGGF